MAVYSVDNSNKRFTLKLTLTEGTVDAAKNISPVSYKLELVANTSYHFSQFSIGSKVVLDGKTVHNQARTASKQYSIAAKGSLTLASGSVDITHDDDGSKKMAFSFSIDMAIADYAPGPLSKSGSMDLTRIARKATVTSAEDFSDEDSPTIKFDNPGKFDVKPYFNVYDNSDKLVYSFEYEKQGQISSPHTFVIPETKREALRKATNLDTSYKVNIGVYTYNGSEYLGYHSKPYTFTIKNANPIFAEGNIRYTDKNPTTFALTESEGQTIVAMASTVEVTYDAATAQKGATISHYDVSLGSAYNSMHSPEGKTIDMGAVTSSGDIVLSIRVVDSRGNSTIARKTVTVLDYNAPKLLPYGNSISCKRCDEDGNSSSQGQFLKVATCGQWSALPNGNNKAKLQVRFSSDSEWTTIKEFETLNGNENNRYVSTFSFEGKVDGKKLEADKSYTVQLRCIDSIGKYDEMSFRIPTQAVDLHLRKGAAFGEYVAEKDTLKLSYNWTANGIYGLGKCKQLQSGEDLNNCLEFRVYGISSDVCESIGNLPLGHYGRYENGEKVLQAVGGTLKVFSSDGSGLEEISGRLINILQEYTVLSGAYKYRRYVRKNVETGKWTFSKWALIEQEIETAESSD